MGGLSVALANGAAWLGHATRASASPMSFTGARSLTAGMHVHGSFSEGQASWSQQCSQAASIGLDVLYPTDHDSRALAVGYVSSFSKIPFNPKSTTGSLRQQAGNVSGSILTVTAESSASAPASVAMSATTQVMHNQLRRSISGQIFEIAFQNVQIDYPATVEIVFALSLHPAQADRPAGSYEIRVRYGASADDAAFSLEQGGFSGVVSLPTPLNGQVDDHDLTQYVATLWPEMLAIDNSSYGFAVVANSPAAGSVASASLSMTVKRNRIDVNSILEDYAAVFDACRQQNPDLTIYPNFEISNGTNVHHYNYFGVAPRLHRYPDQKTEAIRFAQVTKDIHSLGGVVSCNHPMGYGTTPLLTGSAATNRRHSVLHFMQSNKIFPDVLEVGYPLRGNMNVRQHLMLWDTFSRLGRFMTGNGVNDDHDGTPWSQLTNGFLTGVWAPSVANNDFSAAFRAGRAYFRHAGLWPGGEIDCIVDGAVPMGGVSVGSKSNRSLAVFVNNAPAGGTVRVVTGKVDYQGTDPVTTVKAYAASDFAAGPKTYMIDTSHSCFTRVEVFDAGGNFVGGGNPIWTLRQTPPNGIPASRRF